MKLLLRSINLSMLLFLSGMLVSCGMVGKETTFGTSSTETLGGSCLVQESAKAMEAVQTLAAYSVQDACENSSNYVCESTTFSPNAAASKGAEQQCADVAGIGHVCMTVDTAVASTPASTAKTIFHCSNTQLVNSDGFLFQSRAGTLETALASVVDKCQTRSL
jgi:hypothetical protein